MNTIIVTSRQGVTQHARLIGINFADQWDVDHQECSVYVSGMGYQWFSYQHLQDIVPYMCWYENLTGVDNLTLCQIAYDCNQEGCNLFKGWAALKLLTEDTGQLSNDLLPLAIMTAERHTETLIGRNALQILQEESDSREFGY